MSTMKISYLKQSVRFDADMDEALDYIPSGSCFKNRSGKRINKSFCYEDADQTIYEYCRSVRRSRAHNGQSVPLKYKAKPKNREIIRDTIRHAALDDEVLDLEYARSYYAAAGMC